MLDILILVVSIVSVILAVTLAVLMAKTSAEIRKIESMHAAIRDINNKKMKVYLDIGKIHRSPEIKEEEAEKLLLLYQMYFCEKESERAKENAKKAMSMLHSIPDTMLVEELLMRHKKTEVPKSKDAVMMQKE